MRNPEPRRQAPFHRIRRGLLPAVLFAALLSGALIAGVAVAGDPAPPAAGTPWARVTASVDAALSAKLEAAGVTPARRSDDAEFLRRVYLDVVGTVPTVDEVEAFLSDRSEDKRARALEVLLASPAYADYWGTWWFKTLTGITGASLKNGGQGLKLLNGVNGETFRTWVHDQMAANRPYDQFVQNMVSATGRTDVDGATGFYARWEGKPNDLAGATAKTFLGIRIQCAQCHDHVFEPEWKQKDFQGMAAFFVTSYPKRVELMDEGARGRYAAEITDFDLPKRSPGYRRAMKGKELPEELKQRLEIADVTPKVWMGAEVQDLPGIPRRLLLARWIASKDNPYFAKALVNRYWDHFFGHGIVHPADDFGSFNAPSHPELLDLLAKDFAESGFDLKRLVRILVRTEAYQRTSRWSGKEAPDAALFAKAPVRPLTTEQLYFSLSRASGLERRLDTYARAAGRERKQALFAGFSFVFDDDEMSETEDFQGSIPEGLFLMNGQLAQATVSPAGGTTLQEALREDKRDSDRVRHLYLAAYGREPDSTETNRAVSVATKGKGTQGWEDLFWALLNSAEFMTNH